MCLNDNWQKQFHNLPDGVRNINGVARPGCTQQNFVKFSEALAVRRLKVRGREELEGFDGLTGVT